MRNLKQVRIARFRVRQPLQKHWVQNLGPNVIKGGDSVVVAFSKEETHTFLEGERIWHFILIIVL